MKLLCVSPGYWPAFQYGGPTHSVHGMNKALVRKGVRVTVYTTNVGLGEKVPTDREVDIDGVKVFYFPFTGLLEFVGSTGWQFSWRLTKSLRKNLKKFDLIHICGIWNYTTVVAAYFCKQYDKQYIITPQGTLYPYTIGKKSWKKWLYYNLVVETYIKGASAIRYTSEDEAEKSHTSMGLENTAVVVPNGIDLSEYNCLHAKESLRSRYPILKDKKVILFMGRVHWVKGLDILSKAFGKFARKRKEVYLLIAGPDEEGYGKKVKKWLDEECVAGQVMFTGMLTGKDKLEAFAGSDLFVLPSYSENFGNAIIEAMACELPVIISNRVGIHKEIAEAKAGTVIGLDVEQLVKAMENLLDNPSTCNEMRKKGINLVKERFTWDKASERMINMCRFILSEKRNL